MLNKIKLSGKVVSKPELGNESYGDFYVTYLEVKRASGVADILPLKIPHNATIENIKALENRFVSVDGEIRTYNDDKGRLIIQVFVHSLQIFDYEIENENSVEIEGYICRPTKMRDTPSGRTITDVMIATQRAYKKSSYIPAISWGRNADYASMLNLGDYVAGKGRLQSRLYRKNIDGVDYEKTAYEVSLTYIELIEGTNK